MRTMTRPIPSYLFHIPHKDIVDINELERMMSRKKNIPSVVHVIENKVHGKRLGAIPPHIALIKYR